MGKKFWYLLWAGWFAVALASFGIIEGLALSDSGVTLSATVWHSETVFPLFSFIFGTIVGGLAVHFFGWEKPP